MSGVSLRSMTITRNPFGRVCSTGLGNVPERVDAGGGGVACGVCALTNPAQTKHSRTVLAQRRKGAKKELKEGFRFSFAPLRLCEENSVNKRLRITDPPSSSLPADSTKPVDSYPRSISSSHAV